MKVLFSIMLFVVLIEDLYVVVRCLLKMINYVYLFVISVCVSLSLVLAAWRHGDGEYLFAWLVLAILFGVIHYFATPYTDKVISNEDVDEPLIE